MKRFDGRKKDQMRPVTIELDVLEAPAGSASIRCGRTWVLCSASIEERVPPWLVGAGRGWVTAEYAMLPASTSSRSAREGWKGRWPKGRTQEIGRLIGRALRGATNLEALGERNIIVDCDVLEADGGTRTASVTGGFVALALALHRLRQQGETSAGVLRDMVSAISIGLLEGQGVILDMPYEEDHRAEVDLNLVATGAGDIIEVQCTAEGTPFARGLLDEMVTLGLEGTAALVEVQRQVLEAVGVDLGELIASNEESQ